MKTVSVNCHYCGKIVNVLLKEYNRQTKKGRKHFWCNNSCTAKEFNKAKTKPTIIKKCPECGNEFVTRAIKKEKTYCSRECASRGSNTPEKRSKVKESLIRYNLANPEKLKFNFNTVNTAKGLYKREHWKYEKLENVLKDLGINHKFESPIGKYIFDLALIDYHVLIEFDGREHKSEEYLEKDKLRDEFAKNLGWNNVIRIEVGPQEEIDPNLVLPILNTLTAETTAKKMVYVK